MIEDIINTRVVFGSMIANEFFIGKLVGFDNGICEIEVKGTKYYQKGDSVYPFDDLPEEWKKLGEGVYLISVADSEGMRNIRDSTRCGIFGTIYDCPVVLRVPAKNILDDPID